MRSVLFVFHSMTLGGSTTSLLSLLRTFDYSRFKVDLLLSSRHGELTALIPAEVNVFVIAEKGNATFKKAMSPSYIFSRMKAFYYGKKSGSSAPQLQIISNVIAKKLSKGMPEEYDVAIGFLEGWPNAYVINRVKSKKKIAWIHTDYLDAGFLPKLDREAFAKLDNIVAVSDKCKQSLMKCFPELTPRIVSIENILTAGYVNQLAQKDTVIKLNKDNMCFITVCRLTNNSKGLDRGIQALSNLRKEGYQFNWYIVGDGPDKVLIEGQILQEDCVGCIHLLGKISNPYPVIKQADIFFLPSRYEGKPMAITEAQMLNVPALATEYSSAKEQIEDGVEGIVVVNTDVEIYRGLKYIMDNPQLLAQFRDNLSKVDKSNINEIDKIYELINRGELDDV